ncbi:MAG: ribonuclease J [Candidatus Sungbacteria bacterium]|nr:ribonuclease J [Candidatus Sungbacteria bacterium]
MPPSKKTHHRRYRKPQTQTAPHQTATASLHDGFLRFLPLGGCGEVTRSCYVYEYKDDIVIIDAGLQWPEEDMPGIDYLIPNVSWLIPKRKNIRGIIITHGHYDHIGAIPHLLDPLGHPPVYATALTRGMILKRQEDFPEVKKPKIEIINAGSKIKLGDLSAEFFHVNHNIPDSVGVFLKTPAGNVVHTGDWKFDHSPVNERPADIARLREIAKEGVMLLVSDSTDAEIEGHQISETEVQQTLEQTFQEAPGRIIAATFASLLTRIQQLIWLSEKYNRKVLIEGSSMKSNVAVAQELGYLKIKRGTFITQQELDRFPENRVTIVCTGAQGEDRAVLMRIANNEHRAISLKKNDSIIFSSSVIPGNEATVQRLKDILYKRAGKIYHQASMDIHAGGHAKREELRQMVEIVGPKYFIPIHGNYFMLRLHADLAVASGVKSEHAVIAEDGDIIMMNRHEVKRTQEKAPISLVMVDGLGVGDVREVVLRDRQHLAEDGIFVVIALVDSKTGKIRTSPDIISRGFIYLRESQQMLREVRIKVKEVVERTTTSGPRPINWTHLRDNLRESIGQFLYNKTERRPMVLPVVIEV